jgi:hypothetical protein
MAELIALLDLCVSGKADYLVTGDEIKKPLSGVCRTRYSGADDEQEVSGDALFKMIWTIVCRTIVMNDKNYSYTK